MSVPVCVHCANDPMVEKVRIPLGGSELLPPGFTRKDSLVVIFQCESCKRIESVTE